MVRLAETISRINNQAVTSPTPASDNHIIQSAAMGFALLVKAAPKPAR